MTQISDSDYQRLLEFRTGLRRFLRWSEAEAEAAGITGAQHQLCLAVRGHQGSEAPTIGDLAAVLLLRHHSTVELVDRVVLAGLVERWSDADDGRLTRVRLTPSGFQVLSDLAASHLAELDRIRPGLRALWAGLDDEPRPTGR